MIPDSGKDLGSFNYRSVNRFHVNAFGQWTKFNYSSQDVPGSPSYMWSMIAEGYERSLDGRRLSYSHPSADVDKLEGREPLISR